MLNWKTDAFPADADAIVQRWWRLHIGRFAALLVGLVALILGTLLRG